MEWKIIAAVAVCAALYLLWANGYMVTQAKRALKYVEWGKGKRASFSACSGFTRRRVRFAESRTYRFAFTAELSKGEVSAELLDADKQTLLRLSADAPEGELDLSRGSRYYLVVRFRSATGQYWLSWDEIGSEGG